MKFRNLIAIAILTLSIGLVVSMFGDRKALAATLTVGPLVGPCTGTYQLISLAVLAASPGDTITVCPGTYPELVNVNKTLTILGAQSGVDARLVTRTGLPATESVVTGLAGTTSFYVTANNVTIDGFTVQGATLPNVFGFGIVLGGGTTGANVVNNIVQNNIAGLSLANSGATQAVIRYNVFRNNNQPGPATGTGIYTDEFNAGGTLTNVLIDNNNFIANATEGISFSSSTAGSQSNVTVSNNLFDGNGRAVFLYNIISSTFTGNTLRNATQAATADIRIFGGVNGFTIQCNNLSAGAGRAIRINNDGGSSNSNITITSNNISAYAGIGLEVNSGGYTGGPGSLNAERNYWGSPTGPNDLQGRNPGGTGEEILDPDLVVDFTPFLTSVQGLPCPTPVVGPPTNKDQCKNGGWMTFNTPRTFKNQGDCVSYTNNGK